MSHTLIVLPDDTVSAILEPINAAKRALNIRMFLFTEPTLLHAVIAAHHRGVNVRVMLNPARRSGKSENAKARKALLAAGVKVRDSSAAFALTHQKSMVIDNKIGFVESLNWEPRDLTETRDYAVTTTKKSEVKEMIRCFDADWARKPFKPDPKSRLLWCPNNGRERIAAIIDKAKKSLWLQNERYQDTVIVERLVRAVNRGVRVRIMARAPHKLSGKKLAEGIGGLRIMHDVGAKVHLLHGLKLHGKIVIADGKRAIVGSINLSPGSFDSRRELAIETTSKQRFEAPRSGIAPRLEALTEDRPVRCGHTGRSGKARKQGCEPTGSRAVNQAEQIDGLVQRDRGACKTGRRDRLLAASVGPAIRRHALGLKIVAGNVPVEASNPCLCVFTVRHRSYPRDRQIPVWTNNRLRQDIGRSAYCLITSRRSEQSTTTTHQHLRRPYTSDRHSGVAAAGHFCASVQAK